MFKRERGVGGYRERQIDRDRERGRYTDSQTDRGEGRKGGEEEIKQRQRGDADRRT